MPSAGEFVAYNRTDEEVARVIGADWLIYQNTDDLVACAVEGNPRITRYECSIFDGDYVTGDIDDAYLERLSFTRSDHMKQRREADYSGDHSFIELHNHA
jgi:amidophosphoribosyltransferase